MLERVEGRCAPMQGPTFKPDVNSAFADAAGHAPAPVSIAIRIVESDHAFAGAMARAVASGANAISCPGLVVSRVHMSHSISAVVESEQDEVRLVVCALEHIDGSGLDALSYLRHAHPGIGVMLYGTGLDQSLVREAIMGGALDVIDRDARFLDALPRHIASAVARLDAQEHARQMKRRLHQALGSMTDELARLQTRIDQLEQLAVTDELTGLYNRRFMNDALDEFWRQARSEQQTLGCMVIDIDRFKMLNDRFGHQSGDAALYVLGQVLRENCRKTDIITRYGGDEFCVLMPDIDMRSAIDIATRIDTAFRDAATALLQEEDFEPGLSIGVSITTHSQPRSAMQLVAHADEAMYAAKRDGQPVRARGEEGVFAV